MLFRNAAVVVACLCFTAQARLGSIRRKLASPTLLITEIMFNPSACSDSAGEWIEIFNNGPSEVSLDGWSLGDASGATSALNAQTLAPGQYYVMARTIEGCGGLGADSTFSYALNNGGDSVILYDPSNGVVDEHMYSSSEAAAGKTTRRQSDPFGSPLDTWEEGSTGGSPRAGYAVSGGADVRITEIMFNPSACSDYTGEWIELYNAGTSPADLANWSLGDQTSSVTLPPHMLVSGGYYIVGRTTDGCGGLAADATFGFALGNSGDTVSLLDESGSVVDQHTYKQNDASAGHSIQRLAVGGVPTDVWEQGPSGGSPRAGYASSTSVTTPTSAPTVFSPTIVTRDYSSYSLDILCGSTAGYAVRFSYELIGSDSGNHPRESSFFHDDALPDSCQQTSRSSYSHPNCGSIGRKTNEYCFDRGHLVMANHLDNDINHIQESNMMTNVLPQAAGFNQAGGAWIASEEIIECGRDIPNVLKQVVFGGALFTDASNDYFLASHGIPTPDTFWKVVVRYYTNGTTPDVIAWVMPNSHTSTVLDLYLASVDQVQATTGDTMSELPSTFTELSFHSGTSWSKPAGCDLSR